MIFQKKNSQLNHFLTYFGGCAEDFKKIQFKKISINYNVKQRDFMTFFIILEGMHPPTPPPLMLIMPTAG